MLAPAIYTCSIVLRKLHHIIKHNQLNYQQYHVDFSCSSHYKCQVQYTQFNGNNNNILV